MNSEKIDKKNLIIPHLGVVPFKPEKKTTEMKYNEDIWKKLFHMTSNFKKLRITNIARYSMANLKISDTIYGIITKDLVRYLCTDIEEIKKMTVTESNGGVGGISIKLSEIFDVMNIVEINPVHAELIKHNLEQYNIPNSKQIKIYNEDYLDILYTLEQDIIICDPPWGGLDYKKYKFMKLGLNNINITHIINKLYEKNKFKIFILLAMRNFDLQHFINNIVPEEIIIKNMGKHYYIIILNHKAL